MGLGIQPALTMSFQLQELLMKFSGVAYGVAGIAAAIVVIARLTRHPNISKMNQTTDSPTEFGFASLARCIPYGWIH